MDEPLEFPDPPLDALVLVGEIVYNLRAALDYTVYMLALENTGRDVKGTQFPIETDPALFDARVTGRIGKKRIPRFLNGVHPDHVDLVRFLQPFEGCEWTRVLRDLSNPDKHRHLTVLLAKTWIDPYFHLSAAHYTPPDEPPPVILTLEGDVEVNIVFRDAEGHDVLRALSVLQATVSSVVDLFRETLEAFFVSRRQATKRRHDSPSD